MRWQCKDNIVPKEGYERIINRFLFFPKCVNSQWRWLEYASIIQRAALLTALVPEPPAIKYIGWVSIEWSDSPVMNKRQ